MRLGIALFAVTRFYSTVLLFNTQSIMFWVGLLFILFSFLLLLGGFLSKSWLTRFSAVVLVFVTGYLAIINITNGIDYNFSVFILTGSISLFFALIGNRKPSF
jgi:hypothetical protein